MTKTLPLWAALLFGVICGAVIGTIVAAFYLTLALKAGFQSFDMLALWKASAGTRAAHPEAFKVGFGAVGFGAIGLGARWPGPGRRSAMTTVLPIGRPKRS